MPPPSHGPGYQQVVADARTTTATLVPGLPLADADAGQLIATRTVRVLLDLIDSDPC